MAGCPDNFFQPSTYFTSNNREPYDIHASISKEIYILLRFFRRRGGSGAPATPLDQPIAIHRACYFLVLAMFMEYFTLVYIWYLTKMFFIF